MQLVLYDDDFGTVNPLGNKVSKYKVPAFYFVLGNIPAKYHSCLNDINSVLLSPPALNQKYGYQEIFLPSLDDIKLETPRLKIKFEGQEHIFWGTVSVVVADNLAAHALGGFFVILILLTNFVDFAVVLKIN